MEKYEWAPSEQAVGCSEALPDLPPKSPFSDTDRARVLVVVLRRAHQFVGEGGGPDLLSRAEFILSRARAGNLPAAIYEIIWFVHRVLVEHVIFNHMTKAVIVEESM